jgi:hypothetical protein
MKGGKGMKVKLVAVVLVFLVAFGGMLPVASAEGNPPPSDEEMTTLDSILYSLLYVPGEEISTDFPYPQIGALLNCVIPPLSPVLDAVPLTLGRVLMLVGKLLEHPTTVQAVLSRVVSLIESEPPILINVVDLVLGGIISLSILNPLTWPSDPVCVSIVETCDLTDPTGSCCSCVSQMSYIIGSILLGLPLGGLAYAFDLLSTLV